MTRVLILGVNPFEDVPGYQLLSLLKNEPGFDVIAADDSHVAATVLAAAGAHVEVLSHPSDDERRFASVVTRICERRAVDILLVGSDAALFALASCLHENPEIERLCPQLRWIASNELYGKVALQQWAGRFVETPQRWTFNSEYDIFSLAAAAKFPLVVKGALKGAIQCTDPLEAVVARRDLLRNPANQGARGGAYCEAVVEGEEFSFFVLVGSDGRALHKFAFKKLATTKLGTTLVAKVVATPSSFDYAALLAQVTCPAVLEFECRLDSCGVRWVFEVNARFPSWIGALGLYGKRLLRCYISEVVGGSHDGQGAPAPAPGTLFYRLPQSGFLPLDAAFAKEQALQPTFAGMPHYASAPLWKPASPHQFKIK